MDRYIVVPADEEGYPYWSILDSTDELDPHSAVVEAWKGLPDVEKKVREWCAELNEAKSAN